MSEPSKTDAFEELVGELLDGSGDPNQILRPIGDDEVRRAERREGIELLGLLPWSLDPLEPSPELEARLRARLEREERNAAAPAVAAASEPRAASVPPRPDLQRWLLPLAAMIALVALAVAGWQAASVARLRATVERQSAELEAARVELDRIGDAATQLAGLRTKLELLTSAGSELCALRPGRGSRMQQARGTLFMHPEAENWYLKVVGLEPSADGLRYQLWYLTRSGPVAAAWFGFDAREAVVEVMPRKGPPGVEAVMITLEPDGSERPSSPALLYGDERTPIL